MEQKLAQPVVLLIVGLGGVGAAVQLKVQLADPGGEIFAVFFQAGEEIVGGAHLHARQPVHVLHALDLFQHLAGRAAAAISKAKQQVGFF